MYNWKKLINKMISTLDSKVLKYIFVGVTCNIIEIIGLFLFTELLDILYIISNVLISLITLLVSYALNNCWTFGNKKFRKGRIFFLFGTHFFNITISSWMIYFFTYDMGIYYIKSKILTNIICAIWNYFISKHIIYK